MVDQMQNSRKFWTVHTKSYQRAREFSYGAHVALAITKRLKRFNLITKFIVISESWLKLFMQFI